MKLASLSLRNFRCFPSLDNVTFHALTVFIGENDSGKSSIAEAITLLLSDERPSEDMYYKHNTGEHEEEIVVEGVFVIDESDEVPIDWLVPGRNELRLCKSYRKNGSECKVLGLGFDDSRYATFRGQQALVQRELLQNIKIEPGSNVEARIVQFEQAVKSNIVPRKEASLVVRFSELERYLPRLAKVASAEYENPDSMVQATLRTAAESALYEVDSASGEKTLLPELKQVQEKIKESLTSKVSEMEDTLRRINPRLTEVKVEESINFSRGITATNLMLNVGAGLQPLRAFGEGTKKKLWIGLLEWQRQTSSELGNIPVLQLYDEPDVNLDYSSERKLFAGIIESSSQNDSKVQTVVCTHSVSMIDRAPAKSINLIRSDATNGRVIERIDDDIDDDDLKDFLSSVGRSVGITNSALFYERAFLVVEGETEEEALPVFYRALYGKSMIEDGIVLINMLTCGAWNSVLRILQRNKSHVTAFLLDADCTDPNSSGNITPEKLIEFGFDPSLITERCFYIGTKEFEDAFPDYLFATALNMFYPKQDGTKWNDQEIEVIRSNSPKFSNDVRHKVLTTCKPELRQQASKVLIMKKLAGICQVETIPLTIRQAFERARQLAGL